MAPKNKFTKEEMLDAAIRVVKKKGIEGLTAKTLAEELKISTQPVFTAFGSMDTVKEEVYNAAIRICESYTNLGLKEKIPFFGVGMQYIRFAEEEPELYRLLFLSKTKNQNCSVIKTMKHLECLVRPTLISIYHITEEEADFYFSSLWLVVHSISTLIVSGDCPYSNKEIGQILTDFSISICKSIKEISGFVSGTFDRDKEFQKLIKK